jgi:hypothetical protein
MFKIYREMYYVKHINDSFVVLFRVKGEISNIKIFSCEDGSVYADSLEHLRKTFRNLEELISWHKTNIIKHFSSFGVFDFHLTDPVTDGTEGHTVL